MSIRTGKEAAISGLREYRQELMARLTKLQADLKAVDHSLRLLGGAEEEGPAVDAPTGPASNGAGPQDVVVAFLKSNSGQFFKPSIAARLILQSGYEPNKPAIWSNQVNVIMKRLVAKSIAVQRQDDDGKRVFGIIGGPPQGEG